MPRQKMFLPRIKHPATIGSFMKPIEIRWHYAAQKIVQEILKEDEQKKEQLHRTFFFENVFLMLIFDYS